MNPPCNWTACAVVWYCFKMGVFWGGGLSSALRYYRLATPTSNGDWEEWCILGKRILICGYMHFGNHSGDWKLKWKHIVFTKCYHHYLLSRKAYHGETVSQYLRDKAMENKLLYFQINNRKSLQESFLTRSIINFKLKT